VAKEGSGLPSPLLRFEPNLVKNCDAERECKIIEVDCQVNSVLWTEICDV